jgi:replicative DNA helicase
MQTSKILKRVGEEGQKVEEQEQELRELEILRDYDKEDRVISSEEFQKELESDASNLSQRLFSKIPTLDKLLGGFRPGDLVTITGITGEGKSSLARTICSNLVQSEITSLWFSYEETGRELLEKFPQPYPLFYLPRKLSSRKTEWLHERIGEAIAKDGVKAVFVDNLDFLLDQDTFKKYGNIPDIIKFVCIDLKNSARYWRVSIFLLAHTTQEGMKTGEVNIGSLKGSSAIAQISDTVLVIKRLKDKETGVEGNKSRLTVLKNRAYGKNGTVNLIFQDNCLTEADNVHTE